MKWFVNFELLREVVEVLIGVVNSREDYHLQETTKFFIFPSLIIILKATNCDYSHIDFGKPL